jgi:uncharacterized membrane protein YjfL (UPF0719 family)
MYDIIALICLIGLIIVFFLKLANVFKNCEQYPKEFIWITLALAILLFVGYQVSFWTSIGYEEVINDAGELITITTNEHVTLLNYSYIAWLMMYFCGFLTIIEQLRAFPKWINPKMGRDSAVMPKFGR